jgi:starch synthase
MDILMVALELAPFVRRTAAGETVPALAKALRQLGHRVTVALPRYAEFESHGLLLARRLTPLPAPGGDVTVYDCQLPSGVEVALFDAPGLTDASSLTDAGAASPETLRGLAELGRAAAALVRQRAKEQPFDVVHAHDACAGFVALELERPSPPLVVTLTDAGAGSLLSRESGRLLSPELVAKLELDGRLAALLPAIERAGAITTSSPSFAAALSEPAVTGPLAARFVARAEPAVGVPVGLDYALYNPAVDPALEARYDPEDNWLKARTKGVVLREHRLELDIERPLAFFAGPLEPAHGADVVLAALPALLQAGLMLVVAGAPEQALFDAFRAARDAQPEALSLSELRDDAQLRRHLAAADLALVVPRAAALVTTHLMAQRYGALPVALATYGCADTIVDVEASLETGTGFLFDEPTPQALTGAVGRALAAYASEESFTRLRRRVMRLDLGWDRPARRYAQIYRRLAEG